MLALLLTYLDAPDDKEKLEKMFESYRKQMVLNAHKFLTNDSDCEDAVQNVFYKIVRKNWETVKSIENPIDLRNYLLKATRNASLNITRSKRKENISIDTVNEFNIGGTDPISDEDFVTKLCDRFEYNQVVDAILSLEAKYKDVLYLHFVMEWPVAKTAKSMSQTLSATKKQLVRGKKMLLSSLEKGAELKWQ